MSENHSNTTDLSQSEAPQKGNEEKMEKLQDELKTKDKELELYKTKIADLEKQLSEAKVFEVQYKKEIGEVDELKRNSEEVLTKAKAMIFDKMKLIKNQELQIEALNQQVTSLKDVVTITKDLLEIRNLEIKQLETKIKCMEDKVVAEKERQDLIHKKLENMIRFNGELKREYETQLCLFSALRERYNERELAKGVVNQCLQNGASTSAEAPSPAVSPETGENKENEPQS